VFKDLQLFSWKKDVEQEKKGPVKLLYEAAAQGVVSLLKNQSTDQFVDRVTISGRLDRRQWVGKPQAIFDVLHTSFVHTYKSTARSPETCTGRYRTTDLPRHFGAFVQLDTSR
jgi:hypothetical protein